MTAKINLKNYLTTYFIIMVIIENTYSLNNFITKSNNKVNISNIQIEKGSTFSILYISVCSAAGAVLLIILIIIIFCVCKSKKDEENVIPAVDPLQIIPEGLVEDLTQNKGKLLKLIKV